MASAASESVRPRSLSSTKGLHQDSTELRLDGVLGRPRLRHGDPQRCYLAGSPFPETATLNAAPLGISLPSRM
jgi:hypothetical protein